MIRTFFEKRRVKKVFKQMVRPETMDAVLRGDRPAFTAARIEFVLAFVRGETPEEISERVGRVIDIVRSHDASVQDIVGALVVIAFLPVTSPVAGKRVALVEHLSRELSGLLKIVHGAKDGHHGLIGNERRMAYSFVLQGFDAMLGKLSRLEFGQVEEVDNNLA